MVAYSLHELCNPGHTASSWAGDPASKTFGGGSATHRRRLCI